MDNNEMLIREAVELAKKNGVKFEKGTPKFRRQGEVGRFHIVMITNSRPDTKVDLILDEHFSSLQDHSVKSIADYLIEEFNKPRLGK